MPSQPDGPGTVQSNIVKGMEWFDAQPQLVKDLTVAFLQAEGDSVGQAVIQATIYQSGFMDEVALCLRIMATSMINVITSFKYHSVKDN